MQCFCFFISALENLECCAARLWGFCRSGFPVRSFRRPDCQAGRYSRRRIPGNQCCIACRKSAGTYRPDAGPARTWIESALGSRRSRKKSRGGKRCSRSWSAEGCLMGNNVVLSDDLIYNNHGHLSEEITDDVCVIHYIMNVKPWKDFYCGGRYASACFWNKYCVTSPKLRKWLADVFPDKTKGLKFRIFLEYSWSCRQIACAAVCV